METVRRNRKRAPSLGAWLALLCLPAWSQGKLELQQALPLDGPEFIQPAGLAFSGKTLVLVSAGHDEAVFQVTPQGDKAVYAPYLKLKLPKDAEGRKLAFHAVAADSKGGLYLLSESACRILRVTSGGSAEWQGPGLLEAGTERGLFAGENSGAEGLAITGPGRFLVAASREPRGLIEVDLSGPKPQIKPYILAKSRLPLPRGRKPDFSDLADDQGRLWALAANSDAVCLLRKNGSDYEEGESFGFGHVTNDPKYRYLGLRMGLARGLAFDAQSVYVVLDNKGVARQSDPNDKRPLLLVFKKPRS